MKTKFDYLVIGSGIFGAVFTEIASRNGKSCLVLERRKHLGGNIYTEKNAEITVHKYGAHIFRTDNDLVWNYIKRFSAFNNFINSPLANYRGQIYNLPFNMNTFYQMWQTITPKEAQKRLEEGRREIKGEPTNLEEKAISMVGRDIYEVLIQGYTEKQWGKKCKELPPEIIARIPVRLTYDNNYFSEKYQGIPISGYTAIIEKMLQKATIELNVDYLANQEKYRNLAKRIIFTGAIDEYYDYCLGPLEYRSLRFEETCLNTANFQGVAVVNYTDYETPYTRIIEHKHFEFGQQAKSIITKEYPWPWQPGIEPYYPLNDHKNQSLYQSYQQRNKESQVIFKGRLGEYRYYNMDDTIKSAMALAKAEIAGVKI